MTEEELSRRDETIEFMYKEAGYYAYEIAHELGLPETTVRRILIEKGYLDKDGNEIIE